MVRDGRDYLRRCYTSMVYWFLGLNLYLHEVFCWNMQMDIYIVTVPGVVDTVLYLMRLSFTPE